MAERVHSRIWEAAYAVFADLDFTDLFPDQDGLRTHKQGKLDFTDPGFPSQHVVLADQFEEPGPFTDSLGDSFLYPVLWVLADHADVQDADREAAYLDARERARNALMNIGLPAVEEVQGVDASQIGFNPIFDPTQQMYRHIRSALLFKFPTYEPRA